MMKSLDPHAIALRPQSIAEGDPNDTSNTVKRPPPVYAHTNFSATSKVFMASVIDILS